jgi:hypothetical protein
VSAALALVTASACLRPGPRASRVDPMTLLRNE